MLLPLLQVAAELTPLSVNKVGVQFKVFKIFGLISIKAPPSARGEWQRGSALELRLVTTAERIVDVPCKQHHLSQPSKPEKQAECTSHSASVLLNVCSTV